jgi:hypothetical protein
MRSKPLPLASSVRSRSTSCSCSRSISGFAMTNRVREALSPSALETEVDDRHGKQSREESVEFNRSTYVETWPNGDPHVFARALARVLVRQTLQEHGALTADEAAQQLALAG